MTADDPTLKDVMREIVEIQKDLKLGLKQLSRHDEALYGPSNVQEDGLMWRTSKNEGDISLIKKVAFALVPSTSIIGAVIQWVLFGR